MKKQGIKLKLLMFILAWWEANSLLTIQEKMIETVAKIKSRKEEQEKKSKERGN